ncbi:class A beta-lactamase [Candidatus Palauibacter sp.]|uniref:class A beta-lactamase n=1 Tax=Candidatus Palauibacter sp. TaxID=3101350 RepID=UPI003B02B590
MNTAPTPPPRAPLSGGLWPARRIPARTFALGALLLLPPDEGGAQDSRTPTFPEMPPPGAACVVPDSIGQGLRRISRRVGGEVGVSALHVESGARVSFNGDRRFPMASVSKVPMALEFLRRVDLGEIDPAETIEVTTREFRAGYSPLAEWSGARSVRLTVDSIFTLMLAVSDNTATDVILNMSGGPAAATRRIRDLGVEGVAVDRSEARTFADLVGLADTIPESELYRYQYFRLRDRLPEAHRQAARERYGTDPRDTATPDGMTDLLLTIQDGAGLSVQARAWILDVLGRAESGRRRMRGLLPRSTFVAHKTGTMGGAINDVGIVALPEGAGHLIVSVFVNTLRSTTWRRERTIADMTRFLYDYFSEEYRGRAAAVAVARRFGSACVV